MPHPLETTMAKHGLTVLSVFVPFSQSRNKDAKDDKGRPVYSLNWRVTLMRDGRPVVETDYSAGVGHCPAYRKGAPANWDRPKRDWQHFATQWECENGYEAAYSFGGFRRKSAPVGGKLTPLAIKPEPANVVHSLLMDSDVLDYPKYENWAQDLGYDSDSRKGESVYRACLEIALAVRAGLGEPVMAELRESAQDY